jgi:hypothetical protein
MSFPIIVTARVRASKNSINGLNHIYVSIN